MPDYTAVYLPGLTMTSIAAGTITGGDPVEVAGSGTVQKATQGDSGPPVVGSFKVIGVAAQDAISGARLTIIVDRVVHEGLNDGGVTAGDQLMASWVANRQVKSAPVVSSGPSKNDVQVARSIIGIALITAADGGLVRWMQK